LRNDEQIVVNGEVKLDMKNDPRLAKIQSDLRIAISTNTWKVPENEKEICEKIAELTQKYYGPYDKTSAKMQKDLANFGEKISEIGDKISQLEDKKYQIEDDTKLSDKQKQAKISEIEKEEKQLEKQKAAVEKDKQHLTEKLMKYTEEHNGKSLKDVKYGETVCFQQAAIMSYTMDSVGLKNHFCQGVGHSVGNGMGHAFVQSDYGNKNIIDPTLKPELGTCYLPNRNGKEISKGEVVVVDDPRTEEPDVLTEYGGGRIGFWRNRFPSKEDRQKKKEDPVGLLEGIANDNRYNELDKFEKEHEQKFDMKAMPASFDPTIQSTLQESVFGHQMPSRTVSQINNLIKDTQQNAVDTPEPVIQKEPAKLTDLSKDVVEQIRLTVSQHKGMNFVDDKPAQVAQLNVDDVAKKFEKAMKGETPIEKDNAAVQKPLEVAVVDNGKSTVRQV
jgi:hypothetical protein